MFKNSQKLAISKHFLIATLFIVLMFTAFGVSLDESYAADLNETVDAVGSELNVEDKLENSQDDILNSNNVEESPVSSVEDNEVLGATHTLNGGTFKDINTAISNANSGDTIKLSGTFKPSKNGERIEVTKKLTFTSGSQAVLDGKGVSKIFLVKDAAAGSVFKNLKLINGYATDNGAGMYIVAKNVKISNCVFEKNHGLNAAAICSAYNATRAENMVIENCRFYKNWADRCAGAVGVYGNHSKIQNCIFDSNYATGENGITPYGGAIQIGLDNPLAIGYVYNCQFLNNYVRSNHELAHGGAGCVRSGTVYQNCLFVNNTAGQGGALTYHSSGLIKNCTFRDNTATYYGGALSTGYSQEIMYLDIDDCVFEGNRAPLGGAAQLIGVNINIKDSKFNKNQVTKTGGAINIVGQSVDIGGCSFDGNIANIDGGAVFINGKNTTIHDSGFRHNEAVPDVSKLDDGLGGAIYINSTQAVVKNSEFYYNTARNGSAVYYDKSGDDLNLINNVFFENQAWVYALPIYANDIYYGQTEQIKSIIHGGNNIGDYDNLAVSNAIYNAADNQKIVIDSETPVLGATTSGRLYQDDREYNIEVLMTVVHEDGSVVYNNTLNSNCFGEVFDNLNNLKEGKYFVTAKHIEDTYYKAITNTTTFRVIANVDNKVRKLVTDDEINYEDIVVWTLNITNNGPSNATNVIVTDVLPEGLIWLDDDTNGKYNPQTGILHLDFLAVGDVIVVNIITKINKTGDIVNNVNITADEFDYNLTNNFDEESITVQPASDLAVVKAVNQTKPNYNDLVRWTVTVTNNGPDVAHDVKVQDLIPSSLVWVSDTGAGKYNHNSGVWDVGTLNVGSSVSLNIVTRVKATGMIRNDVSVSGREYDYDKSNNKDFKSIDVDSASDLAIAKLANVSVANFGDLVKWTLVVSNNGPDAATGVKISDVLPRGFVYVSSTKPYSNNIINIGNLAVGQTQSVDIVTRVNVTGSFVNVANVSGNEYDYDLSNNRANKSVLINPASDLAVVKAVNQTKPNYNDLVRWTVTVTNNGPDVAHDVKVQDLLPMSLIFISSNGNYNKDSGVWNVGTLNVGSSVSLNIVTRVNATGVIRNDVSVSGREYDYDKSNNNDSKSIDVSPASDLAIAKLANVSVADFGDLVKWTLVVSNNGPDAATGVKISDVLPRGFVYVSSTKPYSNNIISIGNLAVGQTQSVDIVTRVNVTGSFVNVANVSGNEYDYDLSNNGVEKSILINPASDLIVEKTVNETAPNYHDLVRWTISVTNNGPDVAHDVKVQDLLPKSLIFISSNGNYNKDSGIWNIGTLNNGAKITLEIITKVNKTGVIVNNVSVSAREYDYNKSNNKNNESIEVANATDLSVVKMVNSSIENYHELIKWTIIASNNGPDKATGVYVMDILPEGLELINYTASKGFYDNGMWSVCCMESGVSETLDIICYVNRTGNIVNIANITGNEYDYDLSNNVADESVYVPNACDMAVIKTVNETNPYFGDVIEWDITIINNGPDTATEIYVFDNLPNGLKYLNYVASKGVYDDNGMWYVESLGNGESAYLLLRCEVNTLESVMNVVSVSASEYDWNESNNNDYQGISPNPVCDLSITKLVNTTQANYLDLVKWTLIVTNNGPNDASDVFVDDAIQNGLQLIKIQGDGMYDNSVWYVGDLKTGQSKMLELTCKIIATGEFENSASVWSNEYDPDLSNNRDEKSLLVNPASDLSITKTVSKYKYNVGDLVKYSIKVVNKGPDKATNVEVRELMDDSLVLKSFKASYGDFDDATDVWSIDELDVGDSAFLNIDVMAEKAGIAKNNVSVKSDNYDPDLTNNEDSVDVNITQSPKKNDIPKNHQVTNSNNEIGGFYQSMLQKYISGNPLVMMLVSVVFLLLIPCGISFSKKR